MSIIRTIQESDAENFLTLCRQLDEKNRFMLLEPGERNTTVELVNGSYVDEYYMAKLI